MSVTAQALTNQSDGKSIPDYRKHLMPPWKPGIAPNPAGRPLGARQKVTERFLHDLHDSWVEHGVAALQELRRDYVETYCKIMASLIPKQSAHVRANINTNRPLDSINADLIQAVQALGYDVQPRADMPGIDSSVVAEQVAEPIPEPEVPADGSL